MSLKNPYKKGGMFEGANRFLFARAKELRGKMTDAEIFLWVYLKKGINGFKFRRQHPIGLYIADFYCHKAKLIIEVDGSIHNLVDVVASDRSRQNDLEKWGYNVIRFTNSQVIKNIETVLSQISEILISTQTIQKQITSSNDEL
jgi:imidazole glycerol-phosphate synthase subunit HisF